MPVNLHSFSMLAHIKQNATKKQQIAARAQKKSVANTQPHDLIDFAIATNNQVNIVPPTFIDESAGIFCTGIRFKCCHIATK